jgi:hypothetical protein
VTSQAVAGRAEAVLGEAAGGEQAPASFPEEFSWLVLADQLGFKLLDLDAVHWQSRAVDLRPW